MKSIPDFFRLMRPLNLLIIVFTMYAMRWGVLYGLLHHISNDHPGLDIRFTLNEWKFVISVLVMVLLAAAGNMINDYFDLKVDRVNKPDRVIVGRTVKRRVVMAAHHSFNILATLLAVWLGWETSNPLLVLFPVTMAAALWFYSLVFKKQAWIGNLVVALLVSVVPIWSGIIEVPGLADRFSILGGIAPDFSYNAWKWLFGYAGFAFWTTMIREAQKDLEDIEGDRTGDFKTLPIVWGEKATTRYVKSLFVILIAAVVITLLAVKTELREPSSFTVIALMSAILIVMPAVVSWRLTVRAKKRSDYRAASSWSKLTMAGGILLGALMPLWF